MFALGISIAALAFFGPRQLLETVMKLLHLPAHLYCIDDHLPRQMRGQVLGNEPFNVAVRDHQLESFYAKGHFFQVYFYAPAPVLWRRFERVQAPIAAGFAQALQVVVFQGVSSGECCTRTSRIVRRLAVGRDASAVLVRILPGSYFGVEIPPQRLS